MGAAMATADELRRMFPNAIVTSSDDPPRVCPECSEPYVARWSEDEKRAVLDFVAVATPVLEELAGALPALRALVGLAGELSKGGPSAILGLLGRRT